MYIYIYTYIYNTLYIYICIWTAVDHPPAAARPGVSHYCNYC